VTDWIPRLVDEGRRVRGEYGEASALPDLGVVSLDEFMSEREDDPGWLACPLWPADAYGVIGAIFKAGKTWLTTDLIVSVASGGAWLGVWSTPARKVLAFFGEGGSRKMRRRLRAVATHKGVDLAGLPVRLSMVPPLITSA
jgi:hypothetical protein